MGKDWVLCGSRSYLQVDHIVPFALGGGHSAKNLRLLCGVHNRAEAERVLGIERQLTPAFRMDDQLLPRWE